MDITKQTGSEASEASKPEVKRASEKYSAGVRQANKNNWSAVSASRPEGGREASEKKTKGVGRGSKKCPRIKVSDFFGQRSLDNVLEFKM